MDGERNTHNYEDKIVGYRGLVGKSEAKKPLETCSIMINKPHMHMLNCYGLASLEIC
jgi:hypothetical protein